MYVVKKDTGKTVLDAVIESLNKAASDPNIDYPTGQGVLFYFLAIRPIITSFIILSISHKYYLVSVLIMMLETVNAFMFNGLNWLESSLGGYLGGYKGPCGINVHTPE